MIDDINDAFLKAFNYYVSNSGRGTRTRLAKALNTVPAHITDLAKGRRPTKEYDRRRIAQFFGEDYEFFLEAGRNLIKGRKIRSAEEDWRGLTGDELRERGFITVPFSDNMKLSAGSGGTIVDVTDDADASTVIVHGPSLRRTSSRNLQAFRVGGDSMEPIIAQNGIIIADLSENDPGRLKEGKIYVLCYDLLDGECSVKYLHWAERNRLLAISSPDESRHRPVYKRLDEVVLIGRAIWAWREL